jgi:hypothetical protein
MSLIESSSIYRTLQPLAVPSMMLENRHVTASVVGKGGTACVFAADTLAPETTTHIIPRNYLDGAPTKSGGATEAFNGAIEREIVKLRDRFKKTTHC